MRSYEMVTIFQADLEEHESAVGEIEGVVRNLGGEIVKSSSWGKRRFAYPIQKQTAKARSRIRLTSSLLWYGVSRPRTVKGTSVRGALSSSKEESRSEVMRREPAKDGGSPKWSPKG